MWLLRNDEKGLIYRVVSHKQNIVSRKDGDLLLIGDTSISRKHAQLFVDDENQNEGIILKDLQSKYGTFTIIGDGELTKVSPDQLVTLKSGDFIRFGIQWNLWRVDYVPLLVGMSTLTQEEKAEVRQLVTDLGGQVVNDWQPQCTHLTMNKLTVTVKVVCALAGCQPIVTPSYWKSLTKALSSLQSTLPDCKAFMPPLAEAVLNPSEVSFTPDPARSKLFNGHTFVASSLKQLNRIKTMVTAAGGKAVEFSARVWSESKLMRDKTILMLHSANDRPGSQSSQVLDGYITMARRLRDHGVRCIPEAEIGLAVLYCSLVQYCNPRYTIKSVLGSSSSVEATQPVVICPDSEEQTNSSEHLSDVNTVPRSPENGSSRKRHHEDTREDEEQIKKKADTKEKSQDLFESQSYKTMQPGSSSGLGLALKRTTSVEVSSDAKAPVINRNPSLDMFAPSGTSSSSNNQANVRPSCEDIFSSAENRQKQNMELNNEFPLISKKRSRPQKDTDDASDEFSFTSKKSKAKQQEFKGEDEFSFSSFKKCTKRSRNSDSDMFASNNDSLSNKNATSVPSKVKPVEDEFCFEGKRQSNLKDIFGFPENPKRKRNNESVRYEDEGGSEVKLALISKKEDSIASTSSVQPEVEAATDKFAEETKDLVTYSKNNLAAIKKEVKDAEVDELTKELYNATIVVVKPLVVLRPKTVNTSSVTTSGKNFKKFRKVVGPNKRTVPHIIGGSDLVAYNKGCERVDDYLVPDVLPRPHTPPDVWGF